jgi:hypothetical protein
MASAETSSKSDEEQWERKVMRSVFLPDN